LSWRCGFVFAAFADATATTKAIAKHGSYHCTEINTDIGIMIMLALGEPPPSTTRFQRKA
jgi:hypothetical protein